METRKRRSRVLLKAVLGTANHRRLVLSEESGMSDGSLASEGETVSSSAGVENQISEQLGAPDTKSPHSQSTPLFPHEEQRQISSSSSCPSNSKYSKSLDPTLPQASPDEGEASSAAHAPHSNQLSSNTQSPAHPVLDPPDCIPQPVDNQSSSESIRSTHSTDAMPHPPSNTPSDHPNLPLNGLSSQSHPNMTPCQTNPDSLGSQLLFADQSVPTSPNLALDSRRSSSRQSSSASELEGAAVYDVMMHTSNEVAETKTASSASVCIESQLETKRQVVRLHETRKSLSQPTIELPSEPSNRVRKKKHKLISRMLSVQNSSTDSLPSLRLKSSEKEPLCKSKPRSKKNENEIHPEWRETASPTEEIPIIHSPSSTSGSSASRNLSCSESARSSVSLTLGPLLTTALRIRQTRSLTEARWGDLGEAQLESCFPDRHIRLYVVTWNMQEKKDLPDSLDDLLLPVQHDVAADMFVIGTQESTPSRKEWEVLIQKTLGPYYVLVQSSSIGVIYLSLFIRRDLIWFCSATSTASFATRPVTIIKTKGAVGLSFTVFGSSFLFITSHFAAGKLKVAERNGDMHRIATNLSLCEDARLGTAGVSRDVTTEFDYVFWFGDLNYRVDMDRQTANKCLARSDIMSLLLKDQLTREMLQMHTFTGFSEQPIAFPPSYKFDLNSNRYDTSEKQRVPSWTDRILYKSRTGRGISGCGYTSCPTLKCSDHQPVCGVFRVKLEPSHHLEGVAENVASFDRDVYLRANKLRSTVLAMARATEEVDGTPNSASSIRRDVTGRRPVTSQFCTIL